MTNDDLERYCFRCVVAGEPDTIEATESASNAWQVAMDRDGYSKEDCDSLIVIESTSAPALTSARITSGTSMLGRRSRASRCQGRRCASSRLAEAGKHLPMIPRAAPPFRSGAW